MNNERQQWYQSHGSLEEDLDRGKETKNNMNTDFFSRSGRYKTRNRHLIWCKKRTEWGHTSPPSPPKEYYHCAGRPPAVGHRSAELWTRRHGTKPEAPPHGLLTVARSTTEGNAHAGKGHAAAPSSSSLAMGGRALPSLLATVK
jgi:hypothetical protein